MGYDVFKVGHKYQVFEVGDNSPVGPLHKSRSDAWDYVMEIEAKGMMEEAYGEGTVGKAVARADISPRAEGDGY